MRANVLNSKIEISGTKAELDFLEKEFSYKDKQKEYQLNKMKKNPWMSKSPKFFEMLKEVSGTLVTRVSPTSATLPSGFFFKVSGMVEDLVDSRVFNGASISLPYEDSKKKIDLRDYQREAVDEIKKHHRGIINFATGMGKSKTAFVLIKELRVKTLLIAPSDSIANQLFTELKMLFGAKSVGFLGGGKNSVKDSKIVVAIGASAVNNIDLLKEQDFGLLIFDEAHRTPCDTFFAVAEGLSNIGRIYGLTATPFRSDGKDIYLMAACGEIVIKRDVKWGIDNGFLSPPNFIMREIDTSSCPDFKDDKLKAYKSHVLNSQNMISAIEDDAKSILTTGKSLLILVDQVQHGKDLSKKLGIPFATGTDPKSDDYVNQLNNGTIPGLIGTDGKIGEGTDTRNVDVLIMANFVASKGAVLQCVGRALRLKEGKKRAVIIDYMPSGSSMLKRHANLRLEYYREITEKIKIV